MTTDNTNTPARADVTVPALVEQIMDIVQHTTRTVERFDSYARPVGGDTVPDVDGIRRKIIALLNKALTEKENQ